MPDLLYAALELPKYCWVLAPGPSDLRCRHFTTMEVCYIWKVAESLSSWILVCCRMLHHFSLSSSAWVELLLKLSARWRCQELIHSAAITAFNELSVAWCVNQHLLQSYGEAQVFILYAIFQNQKLNFQTKKLALPCPSHLNCHIFPNTWSVHWTLFSRLRFTMLY